MCRIYIIRFVNRLIMKPHGTIWCLSFFSRDTLHIANYMIENKRKLCHLKDDNKANHQ